MVQPLVSILIPCYNAERYVGEAIRSAVSQTYERTEVVVLDDGSTDSSLDVIKRIAGAGGIRWEAGPNRGGNAARNQLLELANGDFVQWLDADDVLLPDKVELQMRAVRPETDVVLSDYHTFDGQDPSVETNRVSVFDELMHQDLVAYFIKRSVITMLPLHRRQHLISVGGFDESLPCCQEYELHYRMARRVWKSVAHVPHVLSGHRTVPGSVSSHEARVFDVQARLVGTWYESLRERGEMTPQRARAMAATLYGCGRHLARHRLRDEAEAAFSLARTANDGGPLPVRWPMKLLSAIVGPYRAERLRSGVDRKKS